jgi:hypothetical protein
VRDPREVGGHVPVIARCGLRPWRHGRERLDHRDLGHGWRQRDRWSLGQRGNWWHGWDWGNERFHGARAWPGPAPHLIGATEGHCHEHEGHQPESGDHSQESASHGVCPPCRHEVGVDTLVSSSIRAGLGHVNTTGVAGVPAASSPVPPSLGLSSTSICLARLRVCLPVHQTAGGHCLGCSQESSDGQPGSHPSPNAPVAV